MAEGKKQADFSHQPSAICHQAGSVQQPAGPAVTGGNAVPERRDAIPRRWTLHGLNNGTIFGLTRRGVTALPRAVSYSIGNAGTWLAWRMMTQTRAAIAANLAAVFPGESPASLERRARGVLRAYAYDVIDFIRALSAPPDVLDGVFEYRPQDARMVVDLLAQGRGLILLSGHYGNWEAGGAFLRRVVHVPLTIMAKTEADPEVNRQRREIRELLGIDSIEIGKSLDTALQIRRRLAGNHVVAFLMDRHIGRDRVAVNFLGRRAWFLKTPALMGFMTGAPLLPCFIERTAPEHFRVLATEPIFVRRDRPREEAIADATQSFATELEARVRAHPHLWYHFYRYWDAQREDGADHDGASQN
jgi:lauroyl/myristoyl acyltransferase